MFEQKTGTKQDPKDYLSFKRFLFYSFYFKQIMHFGLANS